MCTLDCHTSDSPNSSCSFFFFNDTATTEIYTLSLHDALPIYGRPQAVRDASNLVQRLRQSCQRLLECRRRRSILPFQLIDRSEEHTSELQSQSNLVCRLLLEKKKKTKIAPRELAKLLYQPRLA